MKNLIFFIFSILSGYNLICQDIGISGSYSPNPIAVGGESILTVNWTNNDPFTSYPIGEVWVQITFPANYSPSGTPSGNFTTYFNLEDQGGGNWFGYNTVLIPNLVDLLPIGGGLVLNWPVTGMSITPGATTNFDTNFENLDDVETNDNGATGGLAVEASMPIELTSFSAKSNDCDKVELTWSTGSEVNNDFIEVQRSQNGKTFEVVGTVKGSNSSTGSEYQFEDKANFINGARYYYRLKQVDFDGRSQVHKTISVTPRCTASTLDIDLYPNPALDIINVNLQGKEIDGKLSVQIINAKGDVIRKFEIENGVNASINIADLPGGIYQLTTVNLEQPIFKRFIKLR